MNKKWKLTSADMELMKKYRFTGNGSGKYSNTSAYLTFMDMKGERIENDKKPKATNRLELKELQWPYAV